MTDTQGLSTRNVEKWPNASTLENLCRTLATLAWIEVNSERFEMKTRNNGDSVFQFSNGEGDTASIFFDSAGAVFKGFAHDSLYAYWGAENCPWPNDNGEWLPQELRGFWESEIEDEDISFVAWYLNKSQTWSALNLSSEAREKIVSKDDHHDVDGSEQIWDHLPMNARLYAEWEGAYYDKEYDVKILEAVFNLEPLTKEMIVTLNPDFDFSNRAHLDVIKMIPYPTKF